MKYRFINEHRKQYSLLAVWWRCHRRIVADHLLARGGTVFLITGQGHIDPAKLTGGAVIQADSGVVYLEVNARLSPE